MKSGILAGLATLACGASAAAETRLICENPGREYLVVYESGASDLVLNPDSDRAMYPILVDDVSDARHVVTAATSSEGPTVRLHLRPYQKMEFWSEGEIIQTDGCYAVR
jgi:hypothetical protein